MARMALLLAGLPPVVPGTTLNRLCASGLDAVGSSPSGEDARLELALAGGVESMSRAPFVMGKAEAAFQRTAAIEDTTIGWRFINPLMKQQYGVDSMPETAENVAEEFQVSRVDQDAFALRASSVRHGRRPRASSPSEGEAPELVYQEAELPLRVVRDLFTGDFERALVDRTEPSSGGGYLQDLAAWSSASSATRRRHR